MIHAKQPIRQVPQPVPDHSKGSRQAPENDRGEANELSFSPPPIVIHRGKVALKPTAGKCAGDLQTPSPLEGSEGRVDRAMRILREIMPEEQAKELCECIQPDTPDKLDLRRIPDSALSQVGGHAARFLDAMNLLSWQSGNQSGIVTMNVIETLGQGHHFSSSHQKFLADATKQGLEGHNFLVRELQHYIFLKTGRSPQDEQASIKVVDERAAEAATKRIPVNVQALPDISEDQVRTTLEQMGISVPGPVIHQLKSRIGSLYTWPDLQPPFDYKLTASGIGCLAAHLNREFGCNIWHQRGLYSVQELSNQQDDCDYHVVTREELLGDRLTYLIDKSRREDKRGPGKDYRAALVVSGPAHSYALIYVRDNRGEGGEPREGIYCFDSIQDHGAYYAKDIQQAISEACPKEIQLKANAMPLQAGMHSCHAQALHTAAVCTQRLSYPGYPGGIPVVPTQPDRYWGDFAIADLWGDLRSTEMGRSAEGSSATGDRIRRVVPPPEIGQTSEMADFYELLTPEQRETPLRSSFTGQTPNDVESQRRMVVSSAFHAEGAEPHRYVDKKRDWPLPLSIASARMAGVEAWRMTLFKQRHLPWARSVEFMDRLWTLATAESGVELLPTPDRAPGSSA